MILNYFQVYVFKISGTKIAFFILIGQFLERKLFLRPKSLSIYSFFAIFVPLLLTLIQTHSIMKRILSLVFVACMLFSASSYAQNISSVEVSFNYERQDGPGSNQYAIWVENVQGEVVRTLFVTSYTTKGRARGNEELVRGYIKRPNCVPTWVKAVKANDLSDEEVDVFTGATPKTNGIQTFTWDLKDQQGNIVPNGNYKIFVEATLFFKSIVTYEASFSTEDNKESNLTFTKTLTEEDKDHKGMISEVKGVIK